MATYAVFTPWRAGDQEFPTGGATDTLDARPIESVGKHWAHRSLPEYGHHALIAAAEPNDDEAKAARRFLSACASSHFG